MKEKERLSEEERKWRIQVMRRTAHICSPRAKELEREHYDHGHDPLVKWRELEEVLHGIDKVMEWRFVDPVGTVCLAPPHALNLRRRENPATDARVRCVRARRGQEGDVTDGRLRH